MQTLINLANSKHTHVIESNQVFIQMETSLLTAVVKELLLLASDIGLLFTLIIKIERVWGGTHNGPNQIRKSRIFCLIVVQLELVSWCAEEMDGVWSKGRQELRQDECSL